MSLSRDATYRRELDGLRAVAVLPVILFHAGFETFSGGFVGVDVFYVISGYLITSILLKDLARGSYSLAAFYERRARRILPALFVVVICCMPFAQAWLLPDEYAGFWKSVIAVATFTSNIFFWQRTDYFAPTADNELLLHTWSLAVEEQFYLLFPIYLFLLWRYWKQRLVVVTVTVAIASFAIAAWGSRYEPVANFYLLPGRAWELLAGSCVAFWHARGRRPLSPVVANVAASAGLAAIVVAVLTFDGSASLPSYYLALPVIGAAAIIAFANGRDWTSKVLSLGPVVFIGAISYSAYLWHQPMFGLVRIRSLGEPSIEVWATAIGACLLLAAATWHFVEKPFRNRSGGPLPAVSRAYVLWFSAMGLAGFALAGLFAASSPAAKDAITREGLPPSCLRVTTVDGCAEARAASRPDLEIVLWGDSFADAFGASLVSAAQRESIAVYPRVFHSCPSLLGTRRNEDYRLGGRFSQSCTDYNEAARRFIAERKPDVVVLASAYQYYMSVTNPVDGRPILLSAADPAKNAHDAVLDGLEDTVRFLNENGAAVILVTPHPTMTEFAFRQARRKVLLGADAAEAFRADGTAAGGLRDEMLARFARDGLAVSAASIDSDFCPSAAAAACTHLGAGGEYLTFDGSHLTPFAAKRLAAEIIARVATRGALTSSRPR